MLDKKHRLFLSLFLIAAFLAFAITPVSSAPRELVDDAYTVSLLHFNGPGSLSFDDESGKTWSVNGGAYIDATTPKFGFASGRFDGSGDYLNSVDSSDWQLDGGSNANRWTLDLWARFAGDPGTGQQGFIQQRTDNNNFWGVQLLNNLLYFQVQSGGSTIVNINNAWNPNGDTWYHIAIVKDGSNGYMMFIDGVQIGTTKTDTDPLPDFSGNIRIALYTGTGGSDFFFNGRMDELRISKGVARWTSNFTPGVDEYQPTPTATSTFTSTATSTFTPTFTATFTQTDTPTATATHTSTFTPTNTPTVTDTVPGPTSTYTDTPTSTATGTSTYTPTTTHTPTPTGPTSTPSVPTMYWDGEISYGDISITTSLACLLLVLLNVALIWLALKVAPVSKKRK